LPTVGGQSAAQVAYLAKRKEQWSAAMKQEYSDSRRLAASLASKREYKGAPPISLLARANFKRLGTVSITGQAVRGGSVGARSTIAQYLRTRRQTATEDPREEANESETPADTPTEKHTAVQSSESVWGGSWRADGPELHPVVVRVEEAEAKEEVDGGAERDGDECKLTARENKPRPPAEPELSEEEMAARKAAKKRAQEAKKSAREVAQQHHVEAKKKKTKTMATVEGTAAKSLRPTSAKSTKSVRVDRAMEAATPAALRAAKKAQARSERERVLKVSRIPTEVHLHYQLVSLIFIFSFTPGAGRQGRGGGTAVRRGG
jgi:hypothetical protein